MSEVSETPEGDRQERSVYRAARGIHSLFTAPPARRRVRGQAIS